MTVFRGILMTWPGRIFAVALIGSLAGGAVFLSRANTPAAKAEIRKQAVTKGSVIQSVAVSGSVAASHQTKMSFKTAGRSPRFDQWRADLATLYTVVGGQQQNVSTVKLKIAQATTSQIVLIGASTRIVKTTEADVKLSDLKVNDQVTVVGTTDATGRVTAIVVGSTNILGQLFGSQTGNAGLGGGARPSASPTKAP